MNEPTLFKPHVLVKAPIVRESRLIADLSMPVRDWSAFDAPAKGRFVSTREQPMLPESVLFLKRQAG